jgi:hypothetical protein
MHAYERGERGKKEKNVVEGGGRELGERESEGQS